MPKIPDHIRREDYPDEDAYGEALADWIESDDFEPGEMRDATPLWRIKAARQAAERAEAFLVDEVRAVHELGFSWTTIGIQLGVSRQAARQRFAVPVTVTPSPWSKLAEGSPVVEGSPARSGSKVSPAKRSGAGAVKDLPAKRSGAGAVKDLPAKRSRLSAVKDLPAKRSPRTRA